MALSARGGAGCAPRAGMRAPGDRKRVRSHGGGGGEVSVAFSTLHGVSVRSL